MGNPLLMDPAVQSAMNRQLYAQQLMNAGMQTSAVISPWQALARGVQGALGGYEMGVGAQELEKYAAGGREAQAQTIEHLPILAPPYMGVPQAAPIQPQQGAGAGGPGGRPTPNNVANITVPGGAGGTSGTGYASFASPEAGVQATVAKLRSWADPSGNLTLNQAIPKWQGYDLGTQPPPGYISPEGYVAAVSRDTGLDPNAPIPLNDPAMMGRVVQSMAKIEKGPRVFGGYDPNIWQTGAQAAISGGGAPRAAAAPAGDGISMYATAAQPTTGAPAPAIAPTSPQDAARQYGIDMAQRYRQAAADAARSPYAAVRAQVPYLLQQSAAAAQLGRFQPMGYTEGGQLRMVDTWTGKEETVGAPLSAEALQRQDDNYLLANSEAARAGRLSPAEMQQYTAIYNRRQDVQPREDPTAGGAIIYAPTHPISEAIYRPPGAAGTPQGPSAPSYAGPGASPVVGSDPVAARANGVPVAPGNPYAGMTAAKGQEAFQAERTRALAAADKTDTDADAARTMLTVTIPRMRQLLNQGVSAGSDPFHWLGRHLQEFMNSDDYAEFHNLSQGLISQMRLGSGINRITNKDMSIFERMTPGVEYSLGANMRILSAMERKANIALEHNQYLHDYADANGRMTGAETAWNRYLQANPIFAADDKGNIQTDAQGFVVNPTMVDRSTWFAQNTDPRTAELLPRGQAPAPPAAARPAAPTPPTNTVTTSDYQTLPPPGPAGATLEAGDKSGRKWTSDGTRWVPQ